MDPLGTLLGSWLGRAPGLPGIQLQNMQGPVTAAPWGLGGRAGACMPPSSINLLPVL